MEKIKLSCAVLCEGKYDKIKLSSVIDGMILTTAGFSVFNNSEKRAMIKKLCEVRGLVIITDSDRAGVFIRQKLKGMLPADRVKHLYIPEIAGKEKRKEKPSKDGLLGVEGIASKTLYDIIKNADPDSFFDGSRTENVPPLTKAQLYSLGLSGGQGSAERREKLCLKLSLPRGLSANALISALEMLGYDLERVKELCDEIL